jgi:hypothetical protein
LIKKIAEFATFNSGNTLKSTEIAKAIRQDITVAIQDGNASFIREAIARGSKTAYTPSHNHLHSDNAALERANTEALLCLQAVNANTHTS